MRRAIFRRLHDHDSLSQPFRGLFTERAVRLRPALLLGLICCVLTCAAAARAQNVQFNKKAVDLGLRGGAKVNPSTHGLEIEIPLGAYPGRAGNSLPVTISYSSKVWRIAYSFFVAQAPWMSSYTGATALYAEHSRAGWTRSLGMPSIDSQSGNEWYNLIGQPKSTGGCTTPNCFAIDRALVRMPDGSAHELRSRDEPLNCNSGSCPAPDEMYAVDGSRLRYQKSTQTLFMPDGSRYLLGSSQYVDRNGNVMTYNGGGWRRTPPSTRTPASSPAASGWARRGSASRPPSPAVRAFESRRPRGSGGCSTCPAAAPK